MRPPDRVFRGSAYRGDDADARTGAVKWPGLQYIGQGHSNGRVWGMGTFSGYDPTELAWPQVESLSGPLREEDALIGRAPLFLPQQHPADEIRSTTRDESALPSS